MPLLYSHRMASFHLQPKMIKHYLLQASQAGAKPFWTTNIKIDVISATACQSMKSHPNLSIEFTGLAPLPTPTSYLKLLSPPVDNPSEPQYVPPSALLKVTGKEDNPTEFASCLLPTFPRLVESEMHILLQVCSPDSLEWVQHMAQFSALVHSSSCPGGLDHVPDIVAPKFHNFVKWIQLARKGQRDYHALACLQEEYRQHGASAKSIVTCQSTLTVQKRKSLVCLIM